MLRDRSLIPRAGTTSRASRLAAAIDAELDGDHVKAAAILREVIEEPTEHMDFPERAALLRELPAGLSEWAVHPSLGNDEARALEPETWRIRRADYDFAVSPEAREIIEAEGIVLLDYRALQPLWAG